MCQTPFHPLLLLLVIYAKAQWKSDCERALRRAIDCNVDNTSGFKCLGPINTTKGLGRWIQTKAFFPLIYFYFSFLCRAIRDVRPINSSIHHASTHPPPSIHSAPRFEPSLRSSASDLTSRKVCLCLSMTMPDTEELGSKAVQIANTKYHGHGYSQIPFHFVRTKQGTENADVLDV